MSKTWTTSGLGRPEAQTATLALRQLPQYVICAAMGLVGGSIGVAIAIGLAILPQELLAPEQTFSLGVVPLMVLASAAGTAVSWLFGRLAQCCLPRLVQNVYEKGLQVILVFSAFTSLLQTLLFFVQV
jgi:hypothetical protein